MLVEDQLAAQPKAWRWRLLLSQLELRNGNSRGAGVHLQQLSRLHPTNPDVLQALALLRLQQGRPQLAINTVQTALKTAEPSKRVPLGLLLADLQRQGFGCRRSHHLPTAHQDAPADHPPADGQSTVDARAGATGSSPGAARVSEAAAGRRQRRHTSHRALAARWGLVTNRAKTSTAVESPSLKEQASEIPNP